MMKHEFDASVGIDTDPECYKKIEVVYRQFDEMFPTREAIAAFYKKHDMNGIERMYREALKIQELERQNKQLTQQLKAASTLVVLLKSDADIGKLVDALKKNDWVEYHLEPVPMPVMPTEGTYQYEFPEWKTQYQQQPVIPQDGKFDVEWLRRHLASRSQEFTDQMIEYAAKHPVTGQSLKSMFLEFMSRCSASVEVESSSHLKMTLEECPVGLFKWNGILVLKTEYTDDMTGCCECYTIDGGERFWGDGDMLNLNQLIVEPVYREE